MANLSEEAMARQEQLDLLRNQAKAFEKQKLEEQRRIKTLQDENEKLKYEVQEMSALKKGEKTEIEQAKSHFLSKNLEVETFINQVLNNPDKA